MQASIKTRQNKIQRLKIFNRTCQVHLVLFSSVFYGGYILYLFLQSKFIGWRVSKPSIIFSFLFPIGIFGLKKLINFSIGFLIDRQESVLKARQTELKDRIEAIKVETKYYQTKDLIEKYESKEKEKEKEIMPVANSVVKKRVENTPNPETKPSQSRSQPQIQMSGNIRPFSPLPPSPPQQIIIRSPTWMDRFMDALIGDDSRNQKYALICSQCFNHNGLVPPEAFQNFKYRCPNCGFLNKREVAVKGEEESKERIKEIEPDNIKGEEEEKNTKKEL